MSLKNFIKKRADFNRMKYIYKILSDEQVASNFSIFRILIVICAVSEMALYAMFKNNYTGFVTVMALCLMMLVFVEIAKIKASRGFVYFGYLTIFMIFEYVLISGFFNADIETVNTYIAISLFIWIISHLFRIPFIRSILSSSEKAAKKKAERFGVLTANSSLIFLIPAVNILRVNRFEDFFEINWELVFFIVHFAFSMFYVWAVNRILFTIIYHEEINAELEQQRKLIEEKKKNRRTLKRKKTEETQG